MGHVVWRAIVWPRGLGGRESRVYFQCGNAMKKSQKRKHQKCVDITSWSGWTK